MGSFWKSQKLIPSNKNQSVLITKIGSRKTQKIANLQKFHATQYIAGMWASVLATPFWIFWICHRNILLKSWNLECTAVLSLHVYTMGIAYRELQVLVKQMILAKNLGDLSYTNTFYSSIDVNCALINYTGKIREFPISWNWGYFGSNLGLTWV